MCPDGNSGFSGLLTHLGESVLGNRWLRREPRWTCWLNLAASQALSAPQSTAQVATAVLGQAGNMGKDHFYIQSPKNEGRDMPLCFLSFTERCSSPPGERAGLQRRRTEGPSPVRRSGRPEALNTHSNTHKRWRPVFPKQRLAGLQNNQMPHFLKYPWKAPTKSTSGFPPVLVGNQKCS